MAETLAQRRAKLQKNRQERLAAGFSTKVDLKRAVQESAVDGRDLSTHLRNSAETELTDIMRKAGKDMDHALREAAAAAATGED